MSLKNNLNKDITVGRVQTNRTKDPKEVTKKTKRPADENRKTIKIGKSQFEKIEDERYRTRRKQQELMDEAIDFWDKYRKYSNKLDEIINFYEQNK